MEDLRYQFVMTINDGRHVCMSNAELSRLDYTRLKRTNTGDNTAFGVFTKRERKTLYAWAYRATNNHRVNKCAHKKKQRQEKRDRRLARKERKAAILAARLKDYELGGQQGQKVKRLQEELKVSKQEVSLWPLLM